MVNHDVSDGLQPLPSSLLLLKQLLPPRDISSVKFRQHVLAERFQGLAGDDLAASRSLNDNLYSNSQLNAQYFSRTKRK